MVELRVPTTICAMPCTQVCTNYIIICINQNILHFLSFNFIMHVSGSNTAYFMEVWTKTRLYSPLAAQFIIHQHHKLFQKLDTHVLTHTCFLATS